MLILYVQQHQELQLHQGNYTKSVGNLIMAIAISGLAATTLVLSIVRLASSIHLNVLALPALGSYGPAWIHETIPLVASLIVPIHVMITYFGLPSQNNQQTMVQNNMTYP